MLLLYIQGAFRKRKKNRAKVDAIPIDGWMDDLRFYVLFNSDSVISWEVDNERLCAMQLCLRLRRFRARIEFGPLDQ